MFNLDFSVHALRWTQGGPHKPPLYMTDRQERFDHPNHSTMINSLQIELLL